MRSKNCACKQAQTNIYTSTTASRWVWKSHKKERKMQKNRRTAGSFIKLEDDNVNLGIDVSTKFERRRERLLQKVKKKC